MEDQPPGVTGRLKGILGGDASYTVYQFGLPNSLPSMLWADPFSLTLALTGIIFVGLAEWTRRRPPRKINHLYGYRTKASMASQERWDFAQQAASVRSRFWGWVMILLAAAGYAVGGLPVAIGVVISMFVVIGSCVLMLMGVESDLKARFGTPPPRNGVRQASS